jgi:mRNA (guanine-N7-)-methyltransferase
MNNDRLVSAHYDEKRQSSIAERKKSRIFKLKAFNNWIKAVLINKYVGQSDRCVDMCCGTGGDLKKWNTAKIISPVSVQQCGQRLRDNPVSFTFDLFTVNCFSPDFLLNLSNQSFGVVFSQFAYYYAFSSNERVVNSLKNISFCLKKGGIFMATIPDSEMIYKRIREAPELSFGNEFYNVKFESKDLFAEYGQEYKF